MSLDIDFVIYADVGKPEPYRIVLASHNITHNCAEMARELGLYRPLWTPELCDYPRPYAIVDTITQAIGALHEHPEDYLWYVTNSEWGGIKDFSDFLIDLEESCEKFPTVKLEVSR